MPLKCRFQLGFPFPVFHKGSADVPSAVLGILPDTLPRMPGNESTGIHPSFAMCSLRSAAVNPFFSNMNAPDFRAQLREVPHQPENVFQPHNSAFDLGNAVVSSKPDSLQW